MGTPDFAVESLSVLMNAGQDICAVVTSPDKPAGRGLAIKESAVKQFAKRLSVPILQPARLKDESFLKELQNLKADLFVVVAFRMLPEEVWNMPPRGTINLHASLLPDYRGAAPINWAIINGEKTTGVTTFFIEKEIDKGNIIDFEKTDIQSSYTVGELHDILMKKGSELLLKTVRSIEQGNMHSISQQELAIPEQELKKAPKLSREICKIDWSKKAEDIYNHIRGLNPYPAAWTMLYNKEKKEKLLLKLFATEIIDGRHNSTPGKIITDHKTYLYITADGGLLNILEVQPEGRKKLTIQDFLRGFREIDKWEISTH